MELITFLELLLASFGGCFLAICLFWILNTMNERQISARDFYKNVELSYLSLIFERAKQLRASGMTDDKIVDRIRYEYDNNIFRFLQYPVTKQKYKDALEYVSTMVHDKSKIEPLKNYIICPNFGTLTYLEMKKAFADEENMNLAKNALKQLLIDGSMDNVNSVMSWFPELFINPVLDPIHPDKNNSRTHLVSAIYYALTYPGDSYEPIFIEKVPFELFGSWMKALEVVYPKAITIAYANINHYRHKIIDLPEWKEWKNAIWKRVNELKQQK